MGARQEKGWVVTAGQKPVRERCRYCRYPVGVEDAATPVLPDHAMDAALGKSTEELPHRQRRVSADLTVLSIGKATTSVALRHDPGEIA